MRLVITSSKGGAGKSTTAVTLARILANTARPLLIDIDAQGATDVFNLDGVDKCRATPDEAVQMAQNATQAVVIDCPPDIKKSRPVIEIATLVVVPAPLDFLALRGSISALVELVAAGVPARMLFTLYEPGNGHHQADREDLRGTDLPQFETTIFRRRAVSDAAYQGQTVIDFAPKSQSAKQYQNLMEEICKAHQ